jgi:hypothetical protein
MDRAGWFDFARNHVLYNRMAKPLQCRCGRTTAAGNSAFEAIVSGDRAGKL